jgi:hypothetical protein
LNVTIRQLQQVSQHYICELSDAVTNIIVTATVIVIEPCMQALELEKSDVRQLRSLCASLESDLVSSLDYATASQVGWGEEALR